MQYTTWSIHYNLIWIGTSQPLEDKGINLLILVSVAWLLSNFAIIWANYGWYRLMPWDLRA